MNRPGNELGLALCEAFDVDPTTTTAITLRVRVGDLPAVDIEQVVRDERDVDGDMIVDAVIRYRLVPLEVES